MSTRKIEVYLSQQALADAGKSKCYFNATPSQNRTPATLIIGKGYTEEEVKAIIETVRLEAVAAVNAMSNWHRGQRSQPTPPVAYVIDKAVELKYGITPPLNTWNRHYRHW